MGKPQRTRRWVKGTGQARAPLCPCHCLQGHPQELPSIWDCSSVRPPGEQGGGFLEQEHTSWKLWGPGGRSLPFGLWKRARLIQVLVILAVQIQASSGAPVTPTRGPSQAGLSGQSTRGLWHPAGVWASPQLGPGPLPTGLGRCVGTGFRSPAGTQDPCREHLACPGGLPKSTIRHMGSPWRLGTGAPRLPLSSLEARACRIPQQIRARVVTAEGCGRSPLPSSLLAALAMQKAAL